MFKTTLNIEISVIDIYLYFGACYLLFLIFIQNIGLYGLTLNCVNKQSVKPLLNRLLPVHKPYVLQAADVFPYNHGLVYRIF